MIIVFQSSGCENSSAHSEIIIPKISEIIELGEMKNLQEFSPVTGCYISKDLPAEEQITICFKKNFSEDFHLKVSSGKKKQRLTFEMNLNKKSDNLYTTLIKGKKILLRINDKMLSIKPEKPKDIEVLTYCWSWGTSLAGDYKKIEGSLGGR